MDLRITYRSVFRDFRSSAFRDFRSSLSSHFSTSVAKLSAPNMSLNKLCSSEWMEELHSRGVNRASLIASLMRTAFVISSARSYASFWFFSRVKPNPSSSKAGAMKRRKCCFIRSSAASDTCGYMGCRSCTYADLSSRLSAIVLGRTLVVRKHCRSVGLHLEPCIWD